MTETEAVPLDATYFRGIRAGLDAALRRAPRNGTTRAATGS
jgi:hypothetical protein